MTPYAKRLSPLTKRMAEDMLVRNLSAKTIDAYTYHVDRFVAFAGQPAEQLGPEQIREFQLHLIREKKVGWSSFNQAVCMLAEIETLRGSARDRRPVEGNTAKMTQQQRRAFSREHVFVTQANTPWRNNLLRRFYSICKRAGIQGAEPNGSVDIHALRVSFTTLSWNTEERPRRYKRFWATLQ